MKKILGTLLGITIFLCGVFIGYAFDNTALGAIIGLFIAALITDRLTGCGFWGHCGIAPDR